MPQFDPYRLKVLSLRAEKGGARLVWYQVQRGRITDEKPVVVLKGYWYFRDLALSPNRRWLYGCFHAQEALIDLAERRWIGLERFRGLPDDLYHLCWSPNSRYLAGIPRGSNPQKLVLLDLTRLQARILTNLKRGKLFDFGWYPDSQKLWYCVEDESKPILWYQTTIAGEQRRLSKAEQRQITEGWFFDADLFRFRQLGVAYSADYSLRIRFPVGSTQTIVETRTGQQWKLSNWMQPVDISPDKQWILGKSLRKVGDGHLGRVFDAVHITSDRGEHVFTEPERDYLLWAHFEQSGGLIAPPGR